MPTLCKASEDLVRSYDRHLSILWDQELERWKLVRFIPNAWGKFNVIWVFEDENGAFIEPTPAYIGEWIRRNDLAQVRGATHVDKVLNHIRDKNRRNREIKERAAAKNRERQAARFGEFMKAGHRFGDNKDAIARYMSTDSEVVARAQEEMDLTEREAREMRKGAFAP